MKAELLTCCIYHHPLCGDIDITKRALPEEVWLHQGLHPSDSWRGQHVAPDWLLHKRIVFSWFYEDGRPNGIRWRRPYGNDGGLWTVLATWLPDGRLERISSGMRPAAETAEAEAAAVYRLGLERGAELVAERATKVVTP